MRDTVNRFIVILAFVASILVLAACTGKSAETAELPADTEILLVYHDGTTLEAGIEELEELLSVQPEEGLYCWGWTDPEGNVYTPGDPAPVSLFQQCCVKLGSPTEHRAYVSPDENGRFEMDRYVSLRDVAGMFGALLTDPEKTGKSAADSEEVRWIEGIERMRRYGILSDSSADPGDRVTYGELYQCLSGCFPKPAGTYIFSDVSSEDACYEAVCLAAEKGWLNYTVNMNSGRDQFITYKEFILLMNSILDRESAPDAIPAEIRLLFMDYPEDETALCALAEAATDHSVETGSEGEVWTEFQTRILAEPGPRWAENDLYWVDESGMYVVDREYSGFLFDREGKYTSGITELDGYVSAVLEEILLPGMSREEKLKTVYLYSVSHFSPGGGLNYEWGTEDWWPEAALTMFKRGKGDCSSFAAVFCALARPLGYRMRVSTGQTFGAGVHSWAYMFVDGEEHIFDPQSEKRYSRNMFDMEPQRWKQFEYDPVYTEEPGSSGSAK
ncbi:MAG: transglutaminase domain-containing protein [Oscillospiraceae bacterium]|nr:transglutaminase domain-containing protein [Oscillospiraceae bacterium]